MFLLPKENTGSAQFNVRPLIIVDDVPDHYSKEVLDLCLVELQEEADRKDGLDRVQTFVDTDGPGLVFDDDGVVVVMLY